MTAKSYIIDYINSNNTNTCYVSQKSGSDLNGGTSEADAFATIQKGINTAIADGTGYWNVIVLGGEYTENITMNVATNVVSVIGLYEPKLTGSLNMSGGTNDESFFVGFEIIGNFKKGSTFSTNTSTLLNCKIFGNCNWSRGTGGVLVGCEFHNSTWTYTINGSTSVFYPSIISGCTFYDCVDVSKTNTINGTTYLNGLSKTLEKNIYYNTTLTIESNNTDIEYCDLYNTQIRYSDDVAGFPGNGFADIPSSYALVTTPAEMRAKRDLDLSVTTPSTYYETCIFADPDFLDPTNDNLAISQNSPAKLLAKNRHSGAFAQSIYIDSTQMTAPAGGSVASGYAESTIAPGTGIEFVCDATEFDRAQIIKRIHVIADIGAGGEILSSQTEDVNKRIIDVDMCFSTTKTALQLDASPETYNTYEIGLIDTDLNFDEINEVAKSVKFKFTIKNEGVSTDFGEVKVSQIIIETEDVLTFENYTDIEIKQFGNFYLMKETSPGTWVGVNDININPKEESTTQVVLDTYSGTPGKVEFTAQELYDLAVASAGDIVLVFAETLDSGLGISGSDLETNLAQITTSAGIPIWSYDLI